MKEILAAISEAMDTTNAQYAALGMSDGAYKETMKGLNHSYVTILREAHSMARNAGVSF